MKASLKYTTLLQDYVLSNRDTSGVALFQLGLMNFYGKGYPQNTKKGLKMIQQAAKMYPYANTFLGHLYLTGEGVTPDDKQALHYLRTAVSQNESSAQLLLGSLYLQHQIVPYNPGYAKNLFEQAVANKNDSAMIALGIYYLEEEFGGLNTKKAYDLFLQAGKLGNHFAYPFLGSMYEQGDPVKKDLFTAFQYYIKGTSKQNVLAHFFLGKYYLDQQNPILQKDAIDHLKVAAETTHIESMMILSKVLLEPTSHYDPVTAIQYLKVLSAIWDKEATYKLGVIYVEGLHTKRNVKEGLKLLRESKTLEAALYLGDLYAKGKIVPYNYRMSANYYMIASKLGNADAMCKMASLILKENIDINPLPLLHEAQEKKSAQAFYLEGMCYLNGTYIKKDIYQAKKLIHKAAKMGHLPAKALVASWMYDEALDEKDKKKAITIFKGLVKKGYAPASVFLYKVFTSKDYENQSLAKKYLKMGESFKDPEAIHLAALEVMDINPVLGLTRLAECIELGYAPAIKTYKKYR